MDWTEYEKQCYLLARYQKQSLADGSFNEKAEKLIQQLSREEQARGLAIMEQMITHAEGYREAGRKYAPILIYLSEPICYGILNHFAGCLGDALCGLGETVEYFDAATRELDELRELGRQKYKAVIGIQTYLFSIRLTNGKLLHDQFDAPLYNMQFDHPTVMHRHWLNAPQRLTVLHHDRNYARFLEEWYPGQAVNRMLPPAGERCGEEAVKCYGLSFLGTYQDWRQRSEELRQLNRRYRGLIRRLLGELKRHSNDTYEACFLRVYEAWQAEGFDPGEQNPENPNAKESNEKESNAKEQTRERIFECKGAYFAVMQFYRAKIILTLLNTGLKLHVFGYSWDAPLFDGYENLVKHPEQGTEESLTVYAQSKLSLNIMSWHKDGMTERIANSMLCRSVVVSDRSTYLEEHFRDGEEIVLFDLERLNELPDKIRELLGDEERMRRMAENAYRIAAREHTWEERARRLLTMIREEEDWADGEWENPIETTAQTGMRTGEDKS